jgi:uncharacterized protein (DUF2336 family)
MLKALFGRLLGKPALPEKPTYEDARAALERHSAELRLDLAGRRGVEPEFLYFLAEDSDPEIRRKVASNPTTPIQADTKLAADGDEGVRAAMAKKIGRLIPGLHHEASEKVRTLVLEMLGRLAEDQVPRVRAIVAEQIKHCKTAPAGLVQRLARDAFPEVAAPILEYSPLLSDADLREIVDLACVTEALTAIARRRNLSPGLCDAVIARLDVGATAALLSNQAANISKAAMERILDAAAENESWHEPLVRRPNLSARVVRRIAGFVSAILIERLAARPGLDPELVEELKRGAKRRIDDGALEGTESSDTAELRVRTAHSAGALDDHFVSGAAELGDRETVTLALALLSKAGIGPARRIMDSRSAHAVTALVWKAGLNMRVSVAIQSAVLKLPGKDMLLARGGTDFPLGPEEMATHLSLFGIAA